MLVKLKTYGNLLNLVLKEIEKKQMKTGDEPGEILTRLWDWMWTNGLVRCALPTGCLCVCGWMFTSSKPTVAARFFCFLHLRASTACPVFRHVWLAALARLPRFNTFGVKKVTISRGRKKAFFFASSLFCSPPWSSMIVLVSSCELLKKKQITSQRSQGRTEGSSGPWMAWEASWRHKRNDKETTS